MCVCDSIEKTAAEPGTGQEDLEIRVTVKIPVWESTHVSRTLFATEHTAHYTQCYVHLHIIYVYVFTQFPAACIVKTGF